MTNKSEQVKTIEDIIAEYENWLKKYGSMGYMSPKGREGHIKEQLKQLAKTNYDVYTAMLDSIAHGKIEVSDDLKGIFNELIKQRETEGKNRTNRGKLYEVVDKDLRALKTPEDKKAFANRLEAYARQNGYANDYYKTAVVLVASKEYPEDVENMVRDVQKKTNERTNTEEKVQQPIDNLTREQADVILKGLPSPLSGEQKRVFTGFLKGASREDDPSHKIYLAMLDLVNNPETAKNYSDEVKNLVKESAKKREHTTDNSISLGNTAATNHSRISGNSGNAGGNMTLSANMDYALKMGPTVLKEELEGMGVTFPRDIIRHAKNGNEYIPTRLLKQWFQENQLSSEQISKLNALVDDRAAFNAKVKEINNRDEYVAAAPVARQAESVQEEKPAEKDTKGKTEEKQRQDIEKENNEYAASLAGMKDEDLAKEKAELEAKAKEGDEAEKAKALQKMAIMEKEEQRREYEYQKESARKLYAENPKKFKKAKETYKNEAEKGTPRAQEFYDIMSEVEKEATASKMKKDKTKADTSAEAKSDDLQKTDKKSLKKAMKNRANDVSNFFKKTLGIKTKKDKEKETSQVVEQQQKAEQQLKAADNRKITLEHDKDGNAVYTLSGYGQFNGGEHNVLCDGKYTVHQSEQFSSVSFKSNNGNQFMEFAQGGRQLSLIQTLKDEITARSSEQAQQAALVAAQQKTNS